MASTNSEPNHISSRKLIASNKCSINDVGAEDCPKWVADMLSMHVNTVKRIEIVRDKKMGENMLYRVLVDYMYHRAVDVDEDLPKECEKDSSSTSSSPKVDGEKSDAPNTAQVADKQVSDVGVLSEHCGTHLEIDGSHPSVTEVVEPAVPDSIVYPNVISIDDEKNLPRPLTKKLPPRPLKKHALPPPPPPASPPPKEPPISDFDEERYEEALLQAMEKKDALNEREYPGILSSLSGDVRLRPPRPPLKEGVREPRDNSAPKYSFGLGYAKTSYDDNLIIARHLRRTESDKFRSLILYAKTPDVLKNFCKHAKKWHYERNKTEKPPPKPRSYSLYLLQVDPEGRARWRSVGLKDARTLKSIVLREGQLEAIVSDFKEFQSKNTRKWYIDHGLPHRRCYMFYGPPGVGKTSTIRALAGELGLQACFLSLSDNHFQNKTLQQAIMDLPKPGMLIIEDIDVLFNERRKSETPSLVTFSGLLNALDGLVSAEGILTVMTTNHPERLDPALTRAGRVDRRFEFKTPDRIQMKNYFFSFYPDANEALAKKFSDLVFARPEKEARCIATVQEHFIYTRGKTAEESVATVDKFFEEYYPHSRNESPLTYTM